MLGWFQNVTRMTWRLCLMWLCVIWCVVPVGATEPDQKPGLMWQRTGLPAVFPLIVKTNPGSDYFMTLHDPQSGDAQLAAFIKGGVFFRVLVPPGTFRVNFAAGAVWEGEEPLFGDETRQFQLEEDLTFKIANYATKSGHLIDLTSADGSPIIEARALCQRYAITGFPRRLPEFDAKLDFDIRTPDPGQLVRTPGAFFDPARSRGADRPAIPTDFAPYFSDPSFSVKEHLC